MLDYDMISKIRARQTARNELLYKLQAADGRASATREREAFPHFPTRVTRPPLRNPIDISDRYRLVSKRVRKPYHH